MKLYPASAAFENWCPGCEGPCECDGDNYDGAPLFQEDVTTPPEVYWNGEPAPDPNWDGTDDRN